MIMYIIDINNDKELQSEEDNCISEDIVLHRDLIRGYTLVPTTMRYYTDFLESVIGKYVSIVVFSYEVPDNLNPSIYEQIAMRFYKELIENGATNYAATCPEIKIYQLDNSGYIATTTAMQEYSTSTYEYEFILEKIIVLFDDVMKYIKPFSTDSALVDFRQLILDGFLNRVNDFYGYNGPYYMDIFAVLKWYIQKLKFIY